MPIEHAPLKFQIYRFFSHLFLPYTTIIFGMIWIEICKISLPDSDINIIGKFNEPFLLSLIFSILLSLPYYLFCIIKRAYAPVNLQIITYLLFAFATLIGMLYLFYRPQKGFDSAIILAIPQIILTYVFHGYWANKYRKSFYLKLTKHE
jgi:hypothetical protein